MLFDEDSHRTAGGRRTLGEGGLLKEFMGVSI